MLDSITNVIAAIAALGTASFGLVDATKAFWGGISRVGFSHIQRRVQQLFKPGTPVNDRTTPLALGAILGTLRANWINGTALADQKAIAKSLLKLCLSPETAKEFAEATGVDGKLLASVAVKLTPKERPTQEKTHSQKKAKDQEKALTEEEADLFGRFDLILTALLDEGYQRADQCYCDGTKLLAGIFSVAIALFAGWDLHHQGIPLLATASITQTCHCYWGHSDMWMALLVGILATPLAPVAKDLTNAVNAGVDAVQAIRKTV